MSRKRNIKKEMFQPTTECVDSLTIDDVTGQAVPESGTGHTYITYSWAWSQQYTTKHLPISYRTQYSTYVLWCFVQSSSRLASF